MNNLEPSRTMAEAEAEEDKVLPDFATMPLSKAVEWMVKNDTIYSCKSAEAVFVAAPGDPENGRLSYRQYRRFPEEDGCVREFLIALGKRQVVLPPRTGNESDFSPEQISHMLGPQANRK